MKTKPKKGRKSAWIEKIQPRLLEIAAWTRDGYTEKQMCEALGIHTKTLGVYKKSKSILYKALKENKAIADLTVENSLYKRAIGYTYLEKIEKIRTNAIGDIVFKDVNRTQKHIQPDTTAQIFWLKNREQEKWRDRREIYNKNETPTPLKIEIIGEDGKDTKIESDLATD